MISRILFDRLEMFNCNVVKSTSSSDDQQYIMREAKSSKFVDVTILGRHKMKLGKIFEVPV